MNSGGTLIVVGCGIELGRHVCERAISEIRSAETVFALADAFALGWLNSIRPDWNNLGELYGNRKDRRETYREMEAALIDPVREGQRVCAVFYGHPGVFAQVPHNAVCQVRCEGGTARMEPGISAEACLYADLGLDPGHRGVQSFEATQFLAYRHRIDPCSLVLLWQVALAGNLACTGFEPRPDRLRILVDKLCNWYAPETEVILYEAARLPIENFRAEPMTLADLPRAAYREHTTLVIPPARALERDPRYWQALSGP